MMEIHRRFRTFDEFESNSTEVCPNGALNFFGNSIDKKIYRSNCLMLINVVLMCVLVGIGTFAPRHRYHPYLRLLLVLASTLFLPIVSEVAATIHGDAYFISILYPNDGQIIAGDCLMAVHVTLVFVWTALVVTIGVNTSIAVVGDAREGRNADPTAELLVKAAWVVYLAFTVFLTSAFFSSASLLRDDIRLKNNKPMVTLLLISLSALVFLPFLKIVVKHVARSSARGSVVFGRNPRLIAGYMAADRDQSGETRQDNGDHVTVPKLLVRGEDNFELEEKAQGYIFKDFHCGEGTKSEGNKLVTLDKVWDLGDDHLMESSQRAKDLCFSFALFKMLRCRFARYTLHRAGFIKVGKFFRHQYLHQSHNNDPERVFRVIADELSFIHDYYYSPVTIFYTNTWVGILNVFVSLLSIGCVLCTSVLLSRVMGPLLGCEQIFCTVWCPGVGHVHLPDHQDDNATLLRGTTHLFGNAYYDVVPVALVLPVLFASDLKNLVSYISSNWVKVALICSYVKQSACGRQFPAMQKFIAFVLDPRRRKLKLPMTHDIATKMKQRSLLPRHVLALPNKGSIQVPKEVKEAILAGLTTQLAAAGPASDQQYIRPPKPPTTTVNYDVGDGGKLDVASSILTWHVATSIFDLNCPHHHHQQQQQQSPSHHRLAATVLSRYCAYLVADRPELLPVDDVWCKKLYNDAKKEAGRLLRGMKKEQDSVITSLKQTSSSNAGSNSSTAVLRVGAALAEALLLKEKDSNNNNNSTSCWKELSRFWSKMILYVAPSESLDAHAEAIARGGELITLLWALLAQAGVVDRQTDDTTEGGASDPVMIVPSLA